MKTHSTEFLRKRKRLLVLPLLILPFTTMAFWSLGGGKGKEIVQPVQEGLNTKLPGAQLGADAQDKMSLYRQAEKDSSESYQQQRYISNDTGRFAMDTSWMDQGFLGNSSYSRMNRDEERLRNQLAHLEQVIAQPPADPTFGGRSTMNRYPSEVGGEDSQMQRLENMMHQISEPDGDGDPEMEQLNTMLERILDIQHPERYREKLRERSLAEKGLVLPVGRDENVLQVPLVATPVRGQYSTDSALRTFEAPAAGFYGLQEPVYSDSIETRAIAAMVPETQTLVSGASLKLKLTEDIYVGGVRIPKGELIYGLCSLSGERLLVEISGIRYGKRKFPVRLSVFGMDAMEGVRVPGAVTRDVKKDGADRAVQGIQLMSLDPSIGAQAAGAGIEAAKNLISHKVKLVSVTVNAGLEVLLVDKQSEN